jgi:hypothetical protein
MRLACMAVLFAAVAAGGCVDMSNQSIGISTRVVQLVPGNGLWDKPPAWVVACEWESKDGLDHDLDVWALARVKGAYPAWPPLYCAGADASRLRLLYKIEWQHGSGEMTTDTDARPVSEGYGASPWSVMGRAELPAPGLRRRIKSKRVRLWLAATTPFTVEASCSIGVASWWSEPFLTNSAVWLSAAAGPATGVSSLFQAYAYIPVNAREFIVSGDTTVTLDAVGITSAASMWNFNASEASDWTPLDPDWNRFQITQVLGSTSPGCVVSFR